MLLVTIGRTLRFLGVLVLVSVVTFLALRLAPGDPAQVLLGPTAGREGVAERLEEIRTEFGLNLPLHEQYWIWVRRAATGDFGESNRSGLPVLPIVLGRLPATLVLLAASIAIAVPSSLILGMTAAWYRNGPVDRALRGFTTLALAIPSFWLGLAFLLLFSVHLGWLPASRYVPPSEGLGVFLAHLVLPAATLSIFLVGALTRFVYVETSSSLGSHYVRTARAMGLPSRLILFRYAGRNSLLPFISAVSLEIVTLVGGAVLVERVFGWSGVGLLMLSSIERRDYQLVQGSVVIITVGVLAIGFLADIAFRLADPRIRRSAS